MELFEDAKTIEVFTATISAGACRHDACGAGITWAQVAESGKLMPFTGRPEPQRTGSRQGKPTTFFLLEDNHWKDCPGAPEFKRKATR